MTPFQWPSTRLEPISTALVRRLIDTQFPEWADLPIYPVQQGGWDNRTFRLGDTMLVRLPSAEWYAAQVPKEQRWLPALAAQLPLPIPTPLALGFSTAEYPWQWSVYQWIDGEQARAERITDLSTFASGLGRFLAALQAIDPSGGPPPGGHNFFRGGPISTYDSETRVAITALGASIDGDTATIAWQQALAAEWKGPSVWIHGDVSEGNLLLTNGQLSAVIDFGCCAVGDPACDFAVAWTLFAGESRRVFLETLSVDSAGYARGRGWALWKALITLANPDFPAAHASARMVVDAILEDVKNQG